MVNQNPIGKSSRSFFFQAEDGIRDGRVTGVQTCALPILPALDAMPVNKSIYNGLGGSQQSKKPAGGRGPANQVTRVNKLKVMPLGGLGEVGKNMMAIEYENDIVIIDIGFGFPGNNQPGVDYVIPDTTYLERNRHKVRAII